MKPGAFHGGFQRFYQVLVRHFPGLDITVIGAMRCLIIVEGKPQQFDAALGQLLDFRANSGDVTCSYCAGDHSLEWRFSCPCHASVRGHLRIC